MPLPAFPNSGAEARRAARSSRAGSPRLLLRERREDDDFAEDRAPGVGLHFRNRIATYRAYRFDKDGRITRPAVVFEAAGDGAALARARALTDSDVQIEVWKGNRRIYPRPPRLVNR